MGPGLLMLQAADMWAKDVPDAMWFWWDQAEVSGVWIAWQHLCPRRERGLGLQGAWSSSGRHTSTPGRVGRSQCPHVTGFSQRPKTAVRVFSLLGVCDRQF